jgi:beta-glucanase (GH16 family)
MYRQILFSICLLSCTVISVAQGIDEYRADFTSPRSIPGMHLQWHDEFNNIGKPNPANWRFETGFVRNQELQWYQPDNANCEGGLLIIESRRERILNPNYKDSSTNWKLSRQYAEYSSSSLKTQGLQEFKFGRFEIRARIDTSMGSWPAIWTLGIQRPWPLNGEVDIMEFYRIENTPTILANLAWGKAEQGGPRWNTKKILLSEFTSKDPDWVKKFHVWRMDWNEDSINLYLDDILLNSGLLKQTVNPDGSNPFLQPQYLLLNLAIGANGGNPDSTNFPIRYEVDYVRYYRRL